MPGKEDIFPLTSSPTLFLPRSVDKRSCSISQIRRGPLVGFYSRSALYLTNHAPIAKAKLHITVTTMRVSKKLWVFIKFICSSSNDIFKSNRFSVSEYAALLQMWPGRMRSWRGGCHKRDSCNPAPHHHHGVLADFPAVFFDIHQQYLSLKKS